MVMQIYSKKLYWYELFNKSTLDFFVYDKNGYDREFYSLYKYHPIREAWLFRGVQDSRWKLRTSLERLAPDNRRRMQNYIALEEKMMRSFKRYAYPNFDRLPQENEFEEWLALMQHYGIATRLLDWTYSFYIAIFFAVEGVNFGRSQNKECSVWAIKSDEVVKKTLENLKNNLDALAPLKNYFQKASDKKPGRLKPLITASEDLNIPGILHMSPLYQNHRLRCQQGTFLLQLNTGISFLKTLIALNVDQKHIIRIDFNISRSDRLEILKNLDRMNINHATMYPDIKGYAQYNNMQAILESPSIPIR